MPMEVHYHHLIRTTPTTTTTTNNNNKRIRKRIKNGVSMGEKNRYKFFKEYCTMLQGNFVKIFNSTQTFKNVFCLKI
jgi:hypothetical protein